MKNNILTFIILICCAVLGATVITEWNFNDSDLLPDTGTGTIGLIGGLANDGFNTGYSVNPGMGWSTTGFPAQGTGNLTAGIQIEFSTEGFQNINLAWVIRHSNTSPNRSVMFYTLDRTASPVVWTQAATNTATAGDTWYPSVFDATGIAGFNNNPNLALKIVAGFGNDTAYVASNPSSSYAGGKWRWDNIIVSGDPAIPHLEINAALQTFYAAPGSLSPIQSYQINAQNLVGHLYVTAPQYFRVRLEGDENFVSQLDLIPRNGFIQKTVQVLFQPTVAGLFEGVITHVNAFLPQQDLPLTGSTTLPEPSAYPTAFSASWVSYYQAMLNWNDSVGAVLPDGYLIIGSKVDAASITAPVDGVPQDDKKLTKNVPFGAQSQLIFELNEAHTYYFKIFPYTNSGAVIDYKTDGEVPLINLTTSTGPIGSTLQPGDLAFVEYATDSPDRFSFVLLRDVLENTKINFTDKAWNGSAFSENEETYEWRGVGRSWTAGEVIHIEEGVLHAGEGIYNPDFEGFSNSGDQIIAYQGYITEPSFLAAFSTTNWIESGVPTNSSSYLPAPLVIGETALSFPTEVDNGVYNGPTTGFAQELRTAMNNPANWTRANSLGSVSFPSWQVNVINTISQPSASIQIQGLFSLRVSWEAVPGANSYSLYASPDPVASFPSGWQLVEPSISGLFIDINLSSAAARQFYRVTASR